MREIVTISDAIFCPDCNQFKGLSLFGKGATASRKSKITQTVFYSSDAVAPCQLDPIPAVQPKQ